MVSGTGLPTGEKQFLDGICEQWKAYVAEIGRLRAENEQAKKSHDAQTERFIDLAYGYDRLCRVVKPKKHYNGEWQKDHAVAVREIDKLKGVIAEYEARMPGLLKQVREAHQKKVGFTNEQFYHLQRQNFSLRMQVGKLKKRVKKLGAKNETDM